MSSTENRDSLTPAWSGDDAEPRPLSADSVARKLREARTDADRDLDDIAHALRIRYDYLLAIEEGRFEDLPGPTYAVGFVRAYADYLKLDTEDIASRFKAEVADFTRRTELVFPSPEPETRIPGSLVFLVSAVLIAGAYGVWYFSSSGSDQVATPPRVDELPEVSTAEAPPPPPIAEVVELPEAPADFVDPSDTDPMSPEAPALEGDAAPADAGPGAQVASADSTATDAVEPPAAQGAAQELEAPAPEEDLAAASETVEAPAVEAPAAESQSQPEAPAEAASESPSQAEGDNDATAAAVPPATELEASESPAEQAAAAAAPAPVPAEEAPAEEVAAAPASDTPAEPATVVVARGAETAETEVEAAPAAEDTAAEESGEPAGVEQRDGVTIAPLPPQAPARQPAPQPEPVLTAELGQPEPEEAAVYGAVNGESRIVVRAIYDSYVLIRDADDKLILTKVLRRGETYRVPDQQGLTMLTGNAGGLQIEVDGQATPSVGEVGAIVRNINLDPARLKSGNATNP